MKIHNFKPYEMVDCNCMEGLLINVIKRVEDDYSLLFADSWRFDYLPNSSSQISQRIKTNRLYHTDLLMDAYGIKMNISDKLKFDDFISIVQKSIANNMPVIAYIDAFYCEWIHHAFNCSHITHCVMITEIDIIEKTMHFFDSSPFIPDKTITFQEFKKMSNNRVISFSFQERMVMSAEFIHEIIINNLPLKENIIKIRDFLDDIFLIDIDKEIINYKNELFTAPLVIKLQEIGRGRIHMSTLLKNVFTKYGNSTFRDCGDRLSIVAKKWLMVRGLFIKTCFKPQHELILNKISSIIDDILNEELEILDVLNSEIPCICRPTRLNKKEIKHTGESISINLNEHFNNKGFGEEGVFSISGGSYCEDLFDVFINSLNNLCFRIRYRDTLFDNIICDSQEIKTPIRCYSSISILGASEWGSFIDKLILKYKEGEEIVDINFSDWGNKIAEFDNESIFWHGQAVVKSDNKTTMFPANIYQISLQIDSSKELSSIKLPSCENMHIFAITCYG